MDGRRFASNLEDAVRVQDSKLAMAGKRIQVVLFKFVTGSSDVALQRLPSIAGRVRKNRHLRMSMEEIFRAFVMGKAGHHQDHSVGKIDVMRSDDGMKQLDHGGEDRLR